MLLNGSYFASSHCAQGVNQLQFGLQIGGFVHICASFLNHFGNSLQKKTHKLHIVPSLQRRIKGHLDISKGVCGTAQAQ